MQQNRKVLLQLALMGYPLIRVRKAMVALTGIPHRELAQRAGVSRQNVTMHITGLRNTPKVQDAIAEAWGIPKEELFADVA
jgi:lambda repressor-like predicted transcriptional regulator